MQADDSNSNPIAVSRHLQDILPSAENIQVRLQGYLCRLLLAVLLCPAEIPIAAQSLAEGANRPEEQRSQAPAEPQAFSDRDVVPGGIAAGNREAIHLVLTLPLLQQYARARTTLLRAMQQSPDLAPQVRGAIGRAVQRGFDGLEHEYAMIPSAVTAIRKGQMDVHSYTVTETAFMIAVGVLAGELSVPKLPGTTVATNAAFLQSHQQEVEIVLKEVTELQDQLARSVQ